MHLKYFFPLVSLTWYLKHLQYGKIGCVALKDYDFQKIPLKKLAPVKYH